MVAVLLLTCCLVAYSTASITKDNWEDFKHQIGGDYNSLFAYNAETSSYSDVFDDELVPPFMFSRLNGERTILANGCKDLSTCKVENRSVHTNTLLHTFSSMLRDDTAMAYDAKDHDNNYCIQFASIADYLLESYYDCTSDDTRGPALKKFALQVEKLRSNL